MTQLSATQRVLETSEFDEETKVILLRALMASECTDCAKEAHKALHRLETGD
jgi:hypothetical protein